MALTDKDALKERMLSYYDCVNPSTAKENYRGETLMNYEVADMIEDCIDNAPVIDAKPVVHGEWNTHTKAGYYVHGGYVCSIYDKEFYYKLGKEKTPFCPYCGADNRGDKV